MARYRLYHDSPNINFIIRRYTYHDWPRQPVYKKKAQRQVFWLKIKTGYWTGIFREFQTGNRTGF